MMLRPIAVLMMVLCMGLLTLSAGPAAAQPGNNTCGQNQASFTIPAGGGTVSQTTGSWNNDGSPCSAIGGGGNAADVYYYWVPNANGPWVLSLCSTAQQFDSVLSIHTFPCPASQGSSLACNDDGGGGTGCGSQLSQIDSVLLSAGSSYIIRVANRMGNTSRTFTLSIALAPPTGACCTGSGCQVVTQANCSGGYNGDGTTCFPSPCGACCTSGGCSISTSTACAGSFGGTGSTCSPNTCGACCIGGTCSITLSSNCAGTFIGTSSTCTPNPCGACCASGVCTITTSTACAGLSGQFTTGLGTCTPNPCLGACCTGACPYTLTTQAACTGVWLNCTTGCACPAPSNDGCFGAISLIEGVAATGNNCWADQAGEATLTPCLITTSKSVWYSFSSPGGFYRFSTCGSPQNTALAIYTTTTCASFTDIAGGCNDNGCGIGSDAAEISAVALPAANYLVRVSSVGSGAAGGPYTLLATRLPEGACCSNLTGVCQISTSALCTGTNTYFGDASTCAANSCVSTLGACCSYNGSTICQVVTRSNCQLLGNSQFAGEGLACAAVNCSEQGGCCFPDGTCLRGLASICYSINGAGSFQGFGSLCVPNPCSLGACCTIDNMCSVTPNAATCTGDFLGAGTTCATGICTDLGACCSVSTCCTITTLPNCTGTWTAFATCEPDGPCPIPLNDHCDQALPLALGIVVSGNNFCADNDTYPSCVASNRTVWYGFTPTHHAAYTFSTCVVAGIDTVLSVYSGTCAILSSVGCNDDALANCSVSQLLSVIPELVIPANAPQLVRLASYSTSAGGAFQLRVTNDTPLGHCCQGHICTLTDELRCVAGIFTPGGSCSPNMCTGACCVGTSCSLVTTSICTGTYQGDGTSCGPVGNPTTCCPANINGQGGISVQDIFDFLGLYFGGGAQGDFNNSGTTSVQDIFDFLAAYFAGCA